MTAPAFGPRLGAVSPGWGGPLLAAATRHQEPWAQLWGRNEGNLCFQASAK